MDMGGKDQLPSGGATVKKTIGQYLERTHPLYVAAGVLIGAYLLIIALDLMPSTVGIFSTEQWEDGAMLNYARSFPLVVTGYFFGALGGMARVYSEETKPDRMNRIFVSAVVGLASYLAVASGVLAKIIYPDLPNELQAASSWQGIALIAIILGLFATETVSHGAKYFKKSLKGAEPSQPQGDE